MEENIATHCNIVCEEERLGAWITDQNADAIPPVCLSFMAPVIVSKCSEDAAHFILHIHTLAVILYCLENLYKMTVSVWILFP